MFHQFQSECFDFYIICASVHHDLYLMNVTGVAQAEYQCQSSSCFCQMLCVVTCILVYADS